MLLIKQPWSVDRIVSIDSPFNQEFEIPWDFEKIKQIYNVNLLDTTQLSLQKDYDRRRYDTKLAIFFLNKQEKEKLWLEDEISKSSNLKLQESLKFTKLSIEATKERIEFLLKDATFTFDELQSELQ